MKGEKEREVNVRKRRICLQINSSSFFNIHPFDFFLSNSESKTLEKKTFFFREKEEKGRERERKKRRRSRTGTKNRQ